MFGLFKKSEARIKVDDKIWMSSEEKIDAIREMLRLNPACLFLVWFEDSLMTYQQHLGLPAGSPQLMTVERAGVSDVAGKMVIFLEHYPLADAEQIQYRRLSLQNVPVLSSLDEPIFDLFGGDRIREMMKRLGMEKGEIVAHDMINSAIRRAQQKIAGKVRLEKKATSAKEWFAMNFSQKKG